METLKATTDTLFILLGASDGAGDARGIRVPRARNGAPQEPGQRAGEDPRRLRDVDDRVLLHRLWRSPTASAFFTGAEALAQKSGYELVKFFFLLTFAAAVPAIVSGGIAERAKFNPQLIATFVLVGSSIRCSKGIAWNQHYGVQAWLKAGVRRGVPRFRGQRRRACVRRLGRPDRGAAARRSPRPVLDGWQGGVASAVVDSRFSRSARGCCRWAGSGST